MKTKKQEAKAQAIKDIKESLKAQGKVFLAFHTNLNAKIQKLVDEQIEKQLNIKRV